MSNNIPLVIIAEEIHHRLIEYKATGGIQNQIKNETSLTFL